MTMKIVIVKFGGSVVTSKGSRTPKVRTVTVQRLGKELKHFLDEPDDVRVLLLHGAGSFGHPLAHKYGLVRGRVTRGRIQGARMTQSAMRLLSSRITVKLKKLGLPIVPLQTHKAVRKSHGLVISIMNNRIGKILYEKKIPMMSGDVVVTDERLTDIVSADDLAVVFAKKLKAKEIVFVTDVDGVYAGTSKKTIVRRLHRNQLKTLTKIPVPQTRNDVTGGMIGKLSKLLQLRSVTVRIVNGNTPGQLLAALQKSDVGTKISL